MSEELKPCPFCNAAAETDFIPERGSYRIECEKLNCATGPICSTEAEAIAAWNRRATPAPAQPEGAQQDKPVAWRLLIAEMLQETELTSNKERADLAEHLGYKVEPLYLHPNKAGAAAPVEGAAWQPIETAPKDRVILLGYAPNRRMNEWERHVFEGRWHEEQATWTSVNGFLVHSGASYWQELPAAPKEKP